MGILPAKSIINGSKTFLSTILCSGKVFNMRGEGANLGI